MRLASSALFLAAVIASGCGSKSAGGGDDAGGGDGDATTDDGGHHGQTPTAVTLVMNKRPTNAAMFSFLVAYQDGAGPWTLAPTPSGDTYTLPIYSSVYAVAWTCVAVAAGGPGGNQLRQVNELQFAVAERTSLAVDVPARCTDRNQNVSLHGTIANTSGGTTYTVKFGDRTATANNQGQYALETPPGTHDLVLLASSGVSIGTDYVASDAFVQRAVAVSANTQLDLDADNAEAVQSFAISNLIGAGRNTASTTLYANGTTAVLVNDSTFGYENDSVAADQMVASDVYDQQLTVAVIGSSQSSSSATAVPADETWVAVPALGAVTSTTATTPYPRITSAWTKYANAVGYAWGATQTPINSGQGNPCGGNGGCTILWTAQLSPGVLGDAPGFQMADLSALTGWNPALQMVAGTKAGAAVQAMSSTTTGDFPALVPPPVGTKRTFATTTFTVTP